MRSAILLATFALLPMTVSNVEAAGCQKGLASAPYIGAADMRIIDRASDHLPAERPGFVHLTVGAAVPKTVARKPLPAAVGKVLPQYRGAGYTAFRVGKRLVIVDRHGILAYMLPIGRLTKPGNCP